MTKDQNELFILRRCSALENVLNKTVPISEVAGDLNVLFGQLKQRALSRKSLSDNTAKRVLGVVSNVCFQDMLPKDWRRIMFLCFSPDLGKESFPEMDAKTAEFRESKKAIRSPWDDAMSRKLPGSYGAGKSR